MSRQNKQKQFYVKGDSMWGYAYINCDRCGRRLKIKLGQKTRRCPYCNKQVKVAGKLKELVK